MDAITRRAGRIQCNRGAIVLQEVKNLELEGGEVNVVNVRGYEVDVYTSWINKFFGIEVDGIISFTYNRGMSFGECSIARVCREEAPMDITYMNEIPKRWLDLWGHLLAVFVQLRLKPTIPIK